MLTIQTFTFNPFSENTYIVFSPQKTAVLIDPGCFSNTENSILKDFINQQELNIEKILLTHAHIDHIFGLQWAFDTFKVPVFLHKLEEEILQKSPDDARRFGFNFPAFEGEIIFLKEKDILFLDDNSLEIKFIPGHSPGHIGFYNHSQQFIISGDALFKGSIGRTDLYKGNAEQLLQSIHNELLTLPDDTTIYAGHGSPTTIARERAMNPFLQ